MATAMAMAMATPPPLCNSGRIRGETVQFSKKWTTSVALVASCSSSSLPQGILLQPSLHGKYQVSPETRVPFSLQRTHVYGSGDYPRAVGTELRILNEEENEELGEGRKEEEEGRRMRRKEDEELEGAYEEEEEKAKKRSGHSWLPSYTTIRRLIFALILLQVVSSLTSTVTFWTCIRCFLETWPFPAAIPLGFCSFFVATKKSESERDKPWNRLVVLLGSLTWLILVPLGFRNGYVRGWPVILFLVYTCFFLVSRFRWWSDEIGLLNSVPEVVFLASVFAGHWLASWEGVQLYFAWNWMFPTRIAISFFVFSLGLHCYATWVLGKCTDTRLSKPMDLVMLGPYQFVRHPMYASYILLFSGYCLALRAYWSMAFLLLATLLYFEHRTRVEEEVLEESFCGQYKAYKENVRYKYFPLLY